MKIRFQADADLNQVIVLATIRREPTIDFQTAQAAHLAGLKDKEVLGVAAHEGRVLVTHDRKTMPKHFADFLISKTNSGVIIVPQHFSIVSVVEDLILIWSATEAEEWVNRIGCLPL